MSKTVSWKERVSGAIATLKQRGGSSLPAIKKALGVDDQTQWRFINAALKSGTVEAPLLFTKNGGKYKNASSSRKGGGQQPNTAASDY